MGKKNLILIGMPGAGKSTTGVILAKRLGCQFIDTDLLIQSGQQQRLQQIIDQHGLEKFRAIEEKTLLDLTIEQSSVVATGGSVVYSAAGIVALQKLGHLIYLQVSLPELQRRINDMGERGLVMAVGQSFEQLFEERTPLYQHAADLTVDCDALTAEQVAAVIETEVLRNWPQLSA